MCNKGLKLKMTFYFLVRNLIYRKNINIISSFSLLSKDLCAKLKHCILMREINHIIKCKLFLKIMLTLNMLTLLIKVFGMTEYLFLFSIGTLCKHQFHYFSGEIRCVAGQNNFYPSLKIASMGFLV